VDRYTDTTFGEVLPAVVDDFGEEEQVIETGSGDAAVLSKHRFQQMIDALKDPEMGEYKRRADEQ